MLKTNLPTRNFVLPAFWGLVLLILSGFPGNNIHNISVLEFDHADKVAHFIMYFIFCFLLIYCFNKSYGKPTLLIFIYAFAISTTYGILMELLQHYVFINRSGNIYDILANSAGALTAVGAFRPLTKLFKKINPFKH